MKKTLLVLLSLGVFTLSLFAGCGAEARPSRPGHGRPPAHGSQESRPSPLSFARIERVIDGCTVLVAFFNGAEPERVRLAGVSVPETAYPDGPPDAYAVEAAAFTTTTLSNRDVWLQLDSPRRDRYGQLLAYLWTEKPRNPNDEEEARWQMFNARLILEGYTRAAAARPSYRYARMFAKFQKEARDGNRGLWWGN